MCSTINSTYTKDLYCFIHLMLKQCVRMAKIPLTPLAVEPPYNLKMNCSIKALFVLQWTITNVCNYSLYWVHERDSFVYLLYCTYFTCHGIACAYTNNGTIPTVAAISIILTIPYSCVTFHTILTKVSNGR